MGHAAASKLNCFLAPETEALVCITAVYNRRVTVGPILHRALVRRRYGDFIDCKTTKGLIVSSVCDVSTSWEGRRLISAQPGAGKRPRSAANATYSHMRVEGRAYLSGQPPEASPSVHTHTHTQG